MEDKTWRLAQLHYLLKVATRWHGRGLAWNVAVPMARMQLHRMLNPPVATPSTGVRGTASHPAPQEQQARQGHGLKRRGESGPDRRLASAPSKPAAEDDVRFVGVLARARAEGYDGTDAWLRAKFDARLTIVRTYWADMDAMAADQSDDAQARGVALLKAIADAGGIGYDAESPESEIVTLLRGLADDVEGTIH
jgi:hypothetical protein